MVKRRRIDGPSVTKKVLLSQAEDLALAALVAQQGTNLSQVLVDAALDPGATITREEHIALIAKLNELKQTTAQVVLELRGSGAAGVEIDAAVAQWRETNVAIYNAVEGLAIR